MTSLIVLLTTAQTLVKESSTGIFSSLSWSEVAAMLGVLTIIGGGFIKLIQRTDEKLKQRVDLLDEELKEKFKICKDEIAEVELRVIKDIGKDISHRDKALEKIELRIEKLHELIIRLIEK